MNLKSFLSLGIISCRLGEPGDITLQNLAFRLEVDAGRQVSLHLEHLTARSITLTFEKLSEFVFSKGIGPGCFNPNPDNPDLEKFAAEARISLQRARARAIGNSMVRNRANLTVYFNRSDEELEFVLRHEAYLQSVKVRVSLLPARTLVDHGAVSEALCFTN